MEKTRTETLETKKKKRRKTGLRQVVLYTEQYLTKIDQEIAAHLANDEADVGLEAEIEHAVGLVQHQVAVRGRTESPGKFRTERMESRLRSLPKAGTDT